jgi:hypothetical protein
MYTGWIGHKSMNLEPISPIIAAIIALATGLLGYSLSSIHNVFENNKKREWELEDRKLQRRLNVLSARLKECRNYLDQENEIATSLSTYENKLIFDKDEDTRDIEYKKIPLMMSNSTKLAASVLNLNDSELNKLTGELNKIIGDEVQNIFAMRKTMAAMKKFDISSELNRLYNFQLRVAEIRKLAMKRIDELEGFDN